MKGVLAQARRVGLPPELPPRLAAPLLFNSRSLPHAEQTGELPNVADLAGVATLALDAGVSFATIGRQERGHS
jgi:hypothetical protein